MNKVALVTGSQRGIGKATIISFAQKGYDVVIDYYEEEEKAISLKEQIEKEYGVKALAIKADVRVESEVQALIEQIVKTFGRIDVLVNNAGIAIDKEFESHTIQDWHDTIDTNLIGPFLVSKYAAKEMVKVGGGRIINISSTNATKAFFPTSVAYDASKAGLVNLTHNLAILYAPYINVNAVLPHWVNTDMNKDLPKELIDEETEKIYLKRFAEPEEIAKVVVFLASDDANYVNNSIIEVSGGY
ncbi:MAG: SDR family oxidoreductase [Bacilli bacterium]|nr:SDR family oxidoreductase [Bacilli bacterium]